MTRSRLFHRLLLLFFVANLSLGLTGIVMANTSGVALSQSKEPTAFLVEVEGIINPVTQRHITNAVKKAEISEAHLVIILLDTPGGLLDPTQKIVKTLLNARLPIVVYIPKGARADSAGTFITTAANFAVMAPGTRIGAASPVAGGGEDLPETIKSKAFEATAALARSIAQERNRNADALEQTVRQAKSYDPKQAVELNVVDFIAQDLDDLLQQLDGKTVTTASGPRILDTKNMVRQKINMGPNDRFFYFLADPNIAAILLTIGGLGIVVEVLNPGLIAPGVIGAIALILAFLSLGNLPVNWAGVTFMLLAFVLFIAEILHSGFGILGIGAIASFILGGILLFSHFGAPHPTLPAIRVSLWVLVPIVAVIGTVGGIVLVTLKQSQKAFNQQNNISHLVGAIGTATTDLVPQGTVQVQSELWTGVAKNDIFIKAGEQVKVVKVEGVILTVAPARDESM